MICIIKRIVIPSSECVRGLRPTAHQLGSVNKARPQKCNVRGLRRSVQPLDGAGILDSPANNGRNSAQSGQPTEALWLQKPAGAAPAGKVTAVFAHKCPSCRSSLKRPLQPPARNACEIRAGLPGDGGGNVTSHKK